MTEQNKSQKTCSACGTQNQPEFAFCQNCGSSLQPQNNNFNQTGWTNPASAYSPYGQDVKISGIPTETVAAAIGPNAHKYVPKFVEMELGNKKLSWNWAVFLLGFFLGLAASGGWFLYRKMYRAGTIILAVGLVLTIITGSIAGSLITAMGDFLKDYDDQYGIYYNYDLDELEIDTESFLYENPEYITRFFTPILGILFISFINFVLVIVVSLFANGIYKDDIVKKINRLNALNAGNTDHFQLSRQGGTNTMSAVLSGIAIFFVNIFIAGYVFYLIMDLAVVAMTF